MNGFNNEFDPNNPYNIFDNRGRPKNIIWSVVSLVAGVLSISLSVFGWAGLVFGILAVAASIVARKTLGYFNGFAVAGLITGIFGTVSSVAVIIIAFIDPALLEGLFGLSGLSSGGATNGGGTNIPSDPNSSM
ncbi:MAG: DUF4190 domain-containing protein [Clostridia bacterium]|nr:DUF4190 domain-containing protein [Clostridia bacterium]